MNCIKCGRKNQPNAINCKHCGEPLERQNVTVQQEHQPKPVKVQTTRQNSNGVFFAILSVVIVGIAVGSIVYFGGISSPRSGFSSGGGGGGGGGSVPTLPVTVPPNQTVPEPPKQEQPTQVPPKQEQQKPEQPTQAPPKQEQPKVNDNARKEKKSAFIQRVEEISNYEVIHLSPSKPQAELDAESKIVYNKWDSLRKEILAYLKTIMSSSEYSNLSAEENNWLAQMDGVVKTAVNESAPDQKIYRGNLAAIDYIKKHCYKLMDLIYE